MKTTNAMRTEEPDFRRACQWWPEFPNKWTPVGWRDHMHKFNVMWNGSIIAMPRLTESKRWEPWRDEPALHLNIMPGTDAKQPDEGMINESSRRVDDGMVLQEWLPDAPVLRSEWSADGVLLRSEVFAHLPGGGEVETGREPLFAWLRLRVHDLCRALPLASHYGFHLLLESPRYRALMSSRNFTVFPGFHAYATELAIKGRPDPAKACRVAQPDGKIRLGVAPGQICSGIVLFPPQGETHCHRLFLQLPARRNAYVDVLLPFCPSDRSAFDRELALGYDAALRETNRFWKRQLKTAARFHTPEPEVNEVLRHSPRFSLNLTEKNPATGKRCKINGSLVYADLWTTPMSMDLVMMLDILGYHGAVRPYLDIFRDEQGTVTPPGEGYKPHPGYYSTPAIYKSIDWLSDNGAVLWTLCRHALLSGDESFAGDFADSIALSCDWIKTNRARTGHGGYEGVLPAAIATDAQTRIQSGWAAGWNYLGLCSAVDVLRRVGHARAAEFAAEAISYRRDFVSALRHKCRRMPTWSDSRGRRRRFVPTALFGDDAYESRRAFYLDSGPLFHVFNGLLPADDPLMRDALAWFREGPQHRLYRHDGNCWQVPVLDHEMSSCEPCYSWNIFHSWQTGDREKAIEGMYSVFAGGISQQTQVSCETRGGVAGNVFSASLAVYLARLAVIDDAIVADELHLLRLAPLAWLRPGDEGVYERVPTVYGSVTLRTRVSRGGGTLDVTYEAEFRRRPKKVVLHVPPVPDLKVLKVNGSRALPRRGTVTLR